MTFPLIGVQSGRPRAILGHEGTKSRRASRQRRLQAGARPALNAFNRGARMRHAQLGTWWERILAVLGATQAQRRTFRNLVAGQARPYDSVRYFVSAVIAITAAVIA